MAQSSSTGIKDFVKHALTSYYKNFQIKLADGPESTDVNPAIKINNGKIYVHNVGNYNGNINNSSTLLEVINSMGNNVNDINSKIIDINGRIASIPGASKMIAGNNNLTVLVGEDGSTYFYVEGYRYNKDTSSFAEGYEKNTANGNYSHAEGQNTKATNTAEHAEGKYNQSHFDTIHSIGIGIDGLNRKNAFEVMQDGSIYVYGLGNYDGSTLTNASTLLDICNSKANKVVNATAGNLASFDANGNLQDRGYEPSDFADADHEHNYIANFSGYDNWGASVSVGEGYPGAGVISLIVKGDGQSTDSKPAEINYSNIDNLNRALATPSSTPEDDATKLITSKAVFDALAEKMNVLKEVELHYDEQLTLYTMHANADDIIPFISAGPQLVVVKYTFDGGGVDNTSSIRTIGSVGICDTREDGWLIELYVGGDVLFGTTTIQAQDRQELEEAIENMFSDYAAGATVTKIGNHIFP